MSAHCNYIVTSAFALKPENPDRASQAGQPAKLQKMIRDRKVIYKPK